MKQAFFLLVLGGGGIAVIGYFLWRTFSDVLHQWQDSRDVRDTKISNSLLKDKLEKENAERLENGCDHRFGESLGGFPPFACRSCGLEEKRPVGPCDHVWRLARDGAPGAVCENCGKKYRPHVSQSTGFGG